MGRALRGCVLCAALLSAAAVDAPPPNGSAAEQAALAAAHAAASGAAADASNLLPGDEGTLHSLLQWALAHADPGELQRQASAAELADAHHLPDGGGGDADGAPGSRALTVEELVAKRARVKEAMDLYHDLPTEAELVRLAAAQLANGTDDAARERALLGLLELVAPLDVANDLHTLGALAPILDALAADAATVRALAAHVAGAAAANNPGVQAQVVALGGVEALLARAEYDEPAVRAKALYALSALARAPGVGQDAFLAAGGARMLRRVLLAPPDAGTTPLLRKKALVLISDLAAAPPPRLDGEDAEATVAPRDASRDELHEPALLRALLALLAPPGAGQAPDDDLTEKVLRAMRVYLTAEPPAAAAAAAAFLGGGAEATLEALRVRLLAAPPGDGGDDDGSYLEDLRALRDDVAAALHFTQAPPRDEL